MKKLALVAAGILWFGVVFLFTFWLTFPSETMAERLKYEVYEGSDGAYQLQLGSVSPWWVGLSGSDVQLYSIETPRGGEPETKLAFAADRARLRVSLFSLLRQTPSVSGGMTLGGGDISFALDTQLDKRDRLSVSAAKLEAEEFPFIGLLGLAGMDVEGSGYLDLEVDIEAPDGMRQAEGKIEISGSNILITEVDPALTGGHSLGMEIPLDDLDLVLDITQGKAEISRGTIRSPKANVDIDGAVMLRDDLTRSSVNMELAVEIGDEFAIFKPMVSDAKGSDGKYHWQCAGSLSRRPRCSAKSRSSVAGRSGSARGSSRGSTPSRTTTRTETSAEDREKRREEIRERLRQRREGAGASGAERPRGSTDRGDDDDRRGDDDDEFDDDDEEFEGDDDDEEFDGDGRDENYDEEEFD